VGSAGIARRLLRPPARRARRSSPNASRRALEELRTQRFDALGARFAALERARLASLAHDWLALDAGARISRSH
jgi:hypothetical protein